MGKNHDDHPSPESYVSKHTDDLIYVVKQSTDPWIRGLCLAALVKYGDDDYDHKQLKAQIDEVKERVDDV